MIDPQALYSTNGQAAWRVLGIMAEFQMAADSRLLYAALLLRAFYAWSVFVMLLGLARTFANRPSRALTYLTAAVFPYYIVHQTIIVVSGYWFTLHEAPLAVEVAAIVGVTILGCVLSYELIRRVAVLRPLFGLPMREKQALQPLPLLEPTAR